MSEQVIIDERFCGPPQSGNGGYVCGVLARLIDGPAEVSLRRPPPLGRPLEVQRLDEGSVVLRDGDTVIADGSPTTLEIDVPHPVSFADAEVAARSYRGFRWHAFPMCFVCGPQRAKGDGLRIFPGTVQGRDIVAAPWTPDASLADEDGTVRPEFLWAALDCPSGWAIFTHSPRFQSHSPPLALLGRVAAKVIGPVARGERCVLVGWPLHVDGRKLYAGSALFSADGLRAAARVAWVLLT
jgi:hypothetical protein